MVLLGRPVGIEVERADARNIRMLVEEAPENRQRAGVEDDVRVQEQDERTGRAPVGLVHRRRVAAVPLVRDEDEVVSRSEHLDRAVRRAVVHHDRLDRGAVVDADRDGVEALARRASTCSSSRAGWRCQERARAMPSGAQPPARLRRPFAALYASPRIPANTSILSALMPTATPASDRGHVLIVVENMSVPADRRVWMEARALVSLGYSVSVVCPQGKERDTGESERLDGVSIHRFPLREARGGAWSYLGEYGSALAVDPPPGPPRRRRAARRRRAPLQPAGRPPPRDPSSPKAGSEGRLRPPRSRAGALRSALRKQRRPPPPCRRAVRAARVRRRGRGPLAERVLSKDRADARPQEPRRRLRRPHRPRPRSLPEGGASSRAASREAAPPRLRRHDRPPGRRRPRAPRTRRPPHAPRRLARDDRGRRRLA